MSEAVPARLSGVTKVFPARRTQPAVHAIGPLDFELGKGEFVSIVGPSGCGKINAARAACRVDRADRGLRLG